MIKKRKQLKECLEIELKAKSLIRLYLTQDYTLIYVYYMRWMEFHYNSWLCCKWNLWHLMWYIVFHSLWKRWSLKTGITIPKNVCDVGISLMHWGSIVVNAAVHIGRNCCIMNNVNIGANGGSSKAPQIGDNVYIGPGAVLFGDITIADGCYIGANSVVTKSCEEKNAVLIGAPAKIIRQEELCWWEKNNLKRKK